MRETLGALLTVRIFFSAMVTFFFAYAAYEATDYMQLARVFPLFLSLTMLGLSLINLVLDIITTLKKREFSGPGAVDLETRWDIPIGDVWSRFGAFLGMLLLLYLCVFVAGYVISLVLFVTIFYRWIARSRWLVAMIAGAAAFVFIQLAAKLLVVDWPPGLINDFMRLPWFLK